MRKSWRWRGVWRWGLFGSIGAGAAGAGFWACFAADLDAQSWAAWVQAYFSVMAIAAAIAVAQWQRGEEQRREDDRQRALAYCKMDMVVSLAVQAAAAFECGELQQRTWVGMICFADTYTGTDAARILELLSRLGPADVIDGKSLIDVLKLRASVAELDHEMREIKHLSALQISHPKAIFTTNQINIHLDAVTATLADLRTTRDGLAVET